MKRLFWTILMLSNVVYTDGASEPKISILYHGLDACDRSVPKAKPYFYGKMVQEYDSTWWHVYYAYIYNARYNGIYVPIRLEGSAKVEKCEHNKALACYTQHFSFGARRCELVSLIKSNKSQCEFKYFDSFNLEVKAVTVVLHNLMLGWHVKRKTFRDKRITQATKPEYESNLPSTGVFTSGCPAPLDPFTAKKAFRMRISHSGGNLDSPITLNFELNERGVVFAVDTVKVTLFNENNEPQFAEMFSVQSKIANFKDRTSGYYNDAHFCRYVHYDIYYRRNTCGSFYGKFSNGFVRKNPRLFPVINGKRTYKGCKHIDKEHIDNFIFTPDKWKFLNFKGLSATLKVEATAKISFCGHASNFRTINRGAPTGSEAPTGISAASTFSIRKKNVCENLKRKGCNRHRHCKYYRPLKSKKKSKQPGICVRKTCKATYRNAKKCKRDKFRLNCFYNKNLRACMHK